jgi:hypothetical protein
MNGRLFLHAAVAGLLLQLWSCRGEVAPGDEPSRRAAGPATQAQPSSRAVAEPPRFAPAAAATELREQRLTASDGAPFDHLGFSVAAGEGVIVAGARFADSAGVDAGAAYVFRRDAAGGWGEEARLVADDAVEHDRFGNAVALDGDTLVVGAHAHHELGRKAGAAYVFRFRRGTWRQEARLAVPGSLRFGHAVAVSGDRIVVGAPGDLVGNLPAGAAYVFHRQGSSWRQEARLTARDAEARDLFGAAVAVSGDLVAVGAPADDDQGSMTGAAYVFRHQGGSWRQEAKLLAEDAAALGEFGKAIALDGETVVAGAEGAGDVGKFAGAAYVFGRQGSGWRQEAKLLAADRKPADRFGNAVAVHRDTITVGAHFADVAGEGSGTAYVFRRADGQWREATKLVPAGGTAGEEFGNAVAIHGGTVAIGALRGGPGGTAAGSVSVFAPEPGGVP